MKKNIFLFLFVLLSIVCGNGQSLKAPSEGKALVYITRSNNLGAGLNFRVFDKETFLGALPSSAYFLYECDPGEHLFWAASENRDYVEATLEANKVYVIDLRAKIGLVIAAVGVEPCSPDNETHVKRIKKVLKKHVEANVASKDRTLEKEDNIAKAMEAYQRIKDDEYSKIKKLLPDMNFEDSDLKGN